jgi:hypothetical protein
MTSPNFAETPAAPATPASSTSTMEDIIEIFYQPSAVFARRRNDPRFWGAFIVASLLLGISIYLMMRNMPNVMDQQWAKTREKMLQSNPQLTDEQFSKMRAMQEKFMPATFVLAGPILITVLSIVLWLIGKLFDGAISMKQAFMVGSFATLPRFIDGFLAGIMAMAGIGANATNMFAAGPSLARFAPATASPLLLAVLSRFSIGTLWATILIAIAYHVVAGMPKPRARLAAAVLWLIGTGYVLFQARALV